MMASISDKTSNNNEPSNQLKQDSRPAFEQVRTTWLPGSFWRITTFSWSKLKYGSRIAPALDQDACRVTGPPQFLSSVGFSGHVLPPYQRAFC